MTHCGIALVANGNGICHFSLLLLADGNMKVRCSIREPQSGQYCIARGLPDSASRSALRDSRRDSSRTILGDLLSSAQEAAGGSRFCGWYSFSVLSSPRAGACGKSHQIRVRRVRYRTDLHLALVVSCRPFSTLRTRRTICGAAQFTGTQRSER